MLRKITFTLCSITILSCSVSIARDAAPVVRESFTEEKFVQDVQSDLTEIAENNPEGEDNKLDRISCQYHVYDNKPVRTSVTKHYARYRKSPETIHETSANALSLSAQEPEKIIEVTHMAHKEGFSLAYKNVEKKHIKLESKFINIAGFKII